jgi:hypothetical protein
MAKRAQNRGNSLKPMSKLRRIFESTQEISFLSPQQEFFLYWNSFLESELGKIYRAIPWREVIKVLKCILLFILTPQYYYPDPLLL